MSRELTLYHYWRSSCSWRVRWSLAHKEISYNSVAVNLLKKENRTPEYLLKSPSGFVPSLEVDGKFLSESMAILEWLEEVYPAKPLLPSDPDSRMQVRQLSMVIVAGTQPLQNLEAQNYHSTDADERKAYAQHWISKGLAVYETLLKSTAGTYSYGGELSLADLCLVPQCYNAERFSVDLGQFPLVEAIYRRCLALKSCDQAAPHNQPGAQK